MAVTPRTKAGADLEDEFFYLDTSEPGQPNTLVARIRAIENETLDKVTAAVDERDTYWCEPNDTGFAHIRVADVLAAIERIRRDDERG